MANKKLSAIISIGGAVAASLKNAIGQTQAGIGRIGEAVAKLETRQRELNNVVAQQGKLGAAASALKVQYAQQELALIDKQIAKLKQRQAAESKLAAAKGANDARRSELRGKIFETVAIGAAAAAPIVQAVKFETAMLGIAKQVDGARDKTGKLTPVYYEMAKAIQALGRELPIPTNEIANMVTAAARMGIAKDDLLEFTRVGAMMSTAFEMPAAELTDSMGKIAGIFKIPIKNITELGDAINYLDDNAISKGSDIIKVMQGDLAGAASTMGLSAKNAAALASTFLTLGESAERADTAASGMLRQLQIAKMNPKKFQVGVGMIGMTSDQLQKGMIADPQKMILQVLEKIKKLPQEQQMEAVTRLFGKDWGGAIAKLAGGVDEYRRQLELANGEAGKGSMSREFQARMDTTAAKWELLKNTLTEFAVVTGDVMLPVVKDLTDTMRPWVASLTEAKREHPLLTKVIFGTALALVGLKVAALVGGFAFTVLRGGWLAARGLFLAAPTIITAVGTALRFAGTSLLWLGRALLMNPIGLAITAIGLAAFVIYKNWEPIKKFFSGLWDGVKSIFDSAVAWIMDKVAIVFNIIDKVKAGIKSVMGGASAIGEKVQGGQVQYDAMGNITGFTSPDEDLPKPAAASSSKPAAVVNDNSQTTFNIAPPAGTSVKEIADEVDARMKRRAAEQRGSRMYDGANQ